MKSIAIYQVDAFTDKIFSGNPAAVCILDTWLCDELMQNIANENNLAETAFVVPSEKNFEIRWFTPTVEVDLCGHATLAAAFVLFTFYSYPSSLLRFISPKSGLLTVEKIDEMFYMDFPTDSVESYEMKESQTIEKCIGIKPLELYKGKTDIIAIIENEKSLKNLQPNFTEISRLNARGLIVSTQGDSVDFVSRFFAPQSGIDEDSVTGSAHTSLLPIWAKKMNKTKFIAHQLSKRDGRLLCELKNDRCLIGGNARLYLTGKITIE